MRLVWAVAAKELVDLSRDRRALLLGFLVPVLAVPVMSLLVEGSTARRLQSPSRVAVAGSPEGRELLRFGEDLVEPVAVGDPEEALRSGQVAAVVEVSAEAGEVREVVVRYRARDPDGLVAKERVAQVVARYALPAVDRTLRAHGLDREALTPVRVREEVVPGGTGWTGRLAPLLVVVWGFAGASLVAADLSAGERERGTWDALRSAPVHRLALVGGKFVACWVAGAVLAVLSASSQLLFAGPGPVEGVQLGGLVVAALCASAVAGSAALVVGSLSRSAREANQWAVPLYLVALATAAGADLVGASQAAFAVPVLNAFLLAQRALAGGPPEGAQVGSAVVSSAGVCLLLLVAAARLVDRD